MVGEWGENKKSVEAARFNLVIVLFLLVAAVIGLLGMDPLQLALLASTVIGRVADVQLTPGPEYRVTGLLFGRWAWLHRLHMLNPFEHYTPRKPNRVSWEVVASIKHPIITLKPGCLPEQYKKYEQQ